MASRLDAELAAARADADAVTTVVRATSAAGAIGCVLKLGRTRFGRPVRHHGRDPQLTWSDT